MVKAVNGSFELSLKKDNKDKVIIVTQDQLTILFNKQISPNKFNVGGAAILEEHSKNHHKDNLGIKFNNPLLINKLRLPIRS